MAHDAFVLAATRHCLLHPEGKSAADLVTAVLALALSLHRELSAEMQRSGAHAGGASWADLVDASRRQFAMLLAALAREPLAPAALLAHESVLVGGLGGGGAQEEVDEEEEPEEDEGW